MADKRVIKVETLDRLAKGFQESRGITDELSLDEMATLAAMGGEDRLIPFLIGDANLVLTEDDLAELTNPLAPYTFAYKTFKSISLPAQIRELGVDTIQSSTFETFKTYASTLPRYALEGASNNSHIYLLASEFNSLGFYLFMNTSIQVLNVHFKDEASFISFCRQVIETSRDVGTSVYTNSPQTFIFYFGENVATDLTVPADITWLGATSGWNSQPMLFIRQTNWERIVFLGDITSISSGTFSRCSNLIEIDFTQCTAVPTAGINAFENTYSLQRIKVRAALYDEWIAATNWASVADKIVAV